MKKSTKHVFASMIAICGLAGCERDAVVEHEQGRGIQVGMVGADLTGCGDGVLNGVTREACDDGNTQSGDGCNSVCVIESGYTCTGAPSVCTDINECALGAKKCSSLATCTNTIGSFACSCNAGYVGDGISCACAAGTLDCDGASSNACEVNPLTNPDHCGACAISTNDGNPCTIDSCVAGLPVHSNLALGASCGGSYVCDAGGNCVGNSIGPVTWLGHMEDAPLGMYAECGPGLYNYPSMELSAIVARADGSFMGLGRHHLTVAGMGTSADSCGTFVKNYYGPDPFTFDGSNTGALTNFHEIGVVRSTTVWSGPSCGGNCATDYYEVFTPGIWPAGQGVVLHREQWFHDGQTLLNPPFETYTHTCLLGELTTPTWSLGTVDTCALHPYYAAGDSAGNVVIRNAAGLTKYDPTGQIILSIPNPFNFPGDLPNCANGSSTTLQSYPCHRQENVLSLGPQGEIHAGVRTATSVWLAKSDSLGALQWTKTFAASPKQSSTTKWGAFSYAVDASGNILVAFDSTSDVDLGLGPMPSLGANDLILAKFDALGNVVWAKRFGNPGFSVSDNTMRPTGTNDMAIALSFTGSVDLGDGVLLTSPVVAKFNASGNLVWSADAKTLLPNTYTYTGTLVLSGHSSGAVFFGATARPPAPTGCVGVCCLPGNGFWYECMPWPVRVMVAKYGP